MNIKGLGLTLITGFVLAACTPAGNSPDEETPETPDEPTPVTAPETTGPVLQTSLSSEGAEFLVRIESVSTPTTLTTEDGGSVPVPLSPGAWVVSSEDAPLFTTGEASSPGLEDIAEDGDATVLGEALAEAFAEGKAGVFNTPVGADMPGPIGPGENFGGTAYEFTVQAEAGEKLSLATMFIQSNDAFYAPNEEGIALFDESGAPISGDVTAQLSLWDSGTEVNEPYGTGANQAPRQAGPNTGETENGVVTLLTGENAPVTTGPVIKVTVTPTAYVFTATLTNVSTDMTLTTADGSAAVPLSPGVWTLHTEDAPLFTTGEASSPGLEDIAEDGDPTVSAEELSDAATEGRAGVFNTPDGADMPGPIGPGGVYSFTFDAQLGDKLSFATMFIQSNDAFYAPDEEGIALFADDRPVSGDVSDQVALWDSGTEVNEPYGTGPNQAPRQSGPNVGETENGVVTLLR